jgi:hypothetical protein
MEKELETLEFGTSELAIDALPSHGVKPT